MLHGRRIATTCLAARERSLRNCRMRQEFDELTFQIEHVIPKKHHGPDEPGNLALACFACNNHKGTNLSGLDSQTGEMTRLFHPRQDKWDEHFEWKEGRLIGLTTIGRTRLMSWRSI